MLEVCCFFGGLEVFPQELTSVRTLASGDCFGRAAGDYFAAAMSALGAEVNDVVGGLDHVQVMLDYHNRVAGGHEAIKAFQQPFDVGEVQACGRLVEDVEDVFAPLQFAEFARQFNALSFAARERCRGLAQGDVAEAELVEHSDLFGNSGAGP
jgi:hypothetical protein